MAPPDYDSAEWADLVPIPQDEGGPNPLAAIAYSPEYSQASDYLRAVMAANEQSQRALALTEHMISMNPAHYTVWIYRAALVDALGISPQTELDWLTQVSLRHLKNYQIWQHRQVVISKLDRVPADEAGFLARVLQKDAKNYHVWSYRQWLVKQFGLWADGEGETESSEGASAGGKGELEYTRHMIEQDVRNNSAWNHRYFIIFRKPERSTLPKEIIDREIAYAQEQIALAPQNQSGWNYLKGVLRFAKRPTSELEGFAVKYADVEADKVQSSHALDTLATIWGGDEQSGTRSEENTAKAVKALDLLGDKYDPIRKNYWEWRKARLTADVGPGGGGGGAVGTATSAGSGIPAAAVVS